MISNKKYQELLELVIAGESLPEGSTEEEKKTFDELLSDHERNKYILFKLWNTLQEINK